MKSVVNGLAQPSRSEVLGKLLKLAAGRITREQASSWAGQWLIHDGASGAEVQVSDFPAWETLMALQGADLFGGDRPYLYGENDFTSWAESLQAAPR